MPETERKPRKRNRTKEERARRTRVIMWAAIALVIAVLAVLKFWEVDFNSIRRNISNPSENGIVSSESLFPVALDSSKNIRIVPQNDKLNILTDVSVSILNPTTGKMETENHGYSNPIMRTAGNYYVLFDQGVNKLRLLSLTKEEYDAQISAPVLYADVAANGSVIYALKTADNKCQLKVQNKNLTPLLEQNVKGSYVIFTAIDESGKHCAWATVSSRDAVMVTTVHTINIGDKKERASIELKGSNLLDLHYCGDDLYVVCDDGVGVISNQKKLKETFKAGEVNTCCFNYTAKGELVYVYSRYSSANENVLAYIGGNGKVKTSVELSQRPKYVSSASNEMTVLFTDKIVTYSLSKGEEKSSAACDDSVSIAHKLSSKCFVCRHQVIDVVEMKAKEK